MIYLLDTNIFVETKKRFAPINIGLSFWKKIKELADAGFIASIDKVKEEINVKGDDLSIWITKELPRGFFRNSSIVDVAFRYADLMNWADNGTYTQAAKDEFARGTIADSFLIAFAATDPANITIVTDENSEPLRRNKVKIPDAAKTLNVRCIKLVDFFKELNESF